MQLFALRLPSQPVPPEILEALATHLTEIAREKLKRWRLPEDALRSLAGQLIPIWYLHQHIMVPVDEEITFGQSKRGKPLLVSPALEPPIDYNTSHDSCYVLFGAVRGQDAQIGVDVMRLPADPSDIEEALQDQLVLRERQVLLGKFTTHQRAKLLTVYWTVKEGYTKAIGEGVGFGLERIHVKVDEEITEKGGNVEFEVHGVDQEKERWKCRVGFMGEGEEVCGWSVIWRCHVKSEPGIMEAEETEVIHLTWEDFVHFFFNLPLKSRRMTISR